MSAPNALVAERRRLLEERRAALAAGTVLPSSTPEGGAAWPPLAPRRAGAPIPMSFAHELLWMLETANPGMHGYNVARAMRMRGPLDVHALQRALDALVVRHEVLRSTFDRVDGEPRQVVHPPLPVRIEDVDVRSREPIEERERAARDVVQRLSRRPFDLTRDLQLRATLVHIDDEDRVILLESHHVASDAWSRNILFDELAALYEGFATGREIDLPELPLQYGDFAVWQRDVLRGERLERLLSYWRAQLMDAPAELALPTDRPRGRAPSFEGAIAARTLPRALLDRIRALSQEQGATLFMTLLAAFDVLLARYSGQDDIVVGSPMAGRSVDGVERIVGYFADTLVLRARLDGNPTFLELLARVRGTALDAYEHQGIPYEKLVLELAKAGRDLQMPLFSAMFTLQDAQQRPFRLHGLTQVPFHANRGATKFDLSLVANERPDGLRVVIEYRADLFEAATVERMLDQFEALLESIARNPTQRIGDLPLLSPADEARVLRAAAGPRVDVPPVTLAELIAARCVEASDAIAVEGGEAETPARLTFAELDSRASALAHALRERGVRPGVGVGVCAERSPELVIALVAVLAAGGHYVPLDPEYPIERLQFMATDAGVHLILVTRRTESELGSALAGDASDSRTVLRIDQSLSSDGNGAESPLEWSSRATPDDLAYVIYTSGSTGRPKGVRIPHRAVVNYLAWMRDAYAVGTGDAILQKAPASFDASIWELFLPLVSGARLVLAPAAAPQDPNVLLAAVRRHRVSLLQLVPSQLRMLIEAGAQPGDLGTVRRLFLGGEALPRELLAQLTQRFPDLAVTNLYGPTEATVYATHWDVDSSDWTADDAVLIGTPIANARVYVTDDAGHLVPDGAVGEILIAGAGVAAGYLNRPELNAERFIPDPFGGAGETAYRTGDRGRVRAGGIEYLGRADGQVKLRGYRVELGEIESVLSRQPEVASAVAMIRDADRADAVLVAYCVAADAYRAADHGALTSTVRARLQGEVPAFMVPAAIVWLDAWPMNANGKLDRRRLPAPTAAAASEYIPPRTDTERAIAGVWAEVLGRERVGLDDDFFALGGHSLAALRISLRVHDVLGVRLPLATILERPSVQALAEVAETQRASAAPTDGAIRRVARDAYRRAPVPERSGPA